MYSTFITLPKPPFPNTYKTLKLFLLTIYLFYLFFERVEWIWFIGDGII